MDEPTPISAIRKEAGTMGDSSPLDLVEQRLRQKVQKVKRRGDEIQAQCPAHEDRNPSLSVGPGRDRDVVIKCHAGCDPEDVMSALDLRWTDFGESDRQQQRRATETAVYTYVDADNRPLYRVHRNSDKTFWQDHLTAHGEWKKGLADTKRVLYRLPEVIEAVAFGKTIWVAEGEKDVDRLRAEGVVATCNSGGAGKFLEAHADLLADSNVTIVCDRDRPGYEHGASVAKMLRARGCQVRTVASTVGKDASDHLGAGMPITAFATIDPEHDEPVPVEWADPKPLSSVETPPTFPLETLPEWMAWHCSSVASELQVPVDLPAMLGLAALAVVSAGKAEVEVKGTWREQLNLYLTVAMPPGSGKSPAFKAMLGVLEQWEAELAEEAAQGIALAEQKLRMTEKAMKRAEDSGDQVEAAKMLLEMQALEVPKTPRLSADDATPEALVQLLNEQKGRLALLSTEGGVFDLMTGRYSDRANLDVYLQAWAGDTIRVDRIGRGAVTIRKPALTIGLTVQPSVLERLSEHPELKGRGLTARFMYSIPPDSVGSRNMVDAPSADPDARRLYNEQLMVLARRLGVYQMPGTLKLCDEARRMFDQWRQRLEDRRVPYGDLRPLAEWTTKLESSVARLTGLLHLADGGAAQAEVSLMAMTRAIAIGEYWLAHARVVHDLWESDPVVADAARVLRWIARSKAQDFSVRDLFNGNRKAFHVVEDCRSALELLTDSGWIRPMFEGELKLGRRGIESPRYSSHPVACGLSQVRNSHASHAYHASRDIKKVLTYSSEIRRDADAATHGTHGTQLQEPFRSALTDDDHDESPQNVAAEGVSDADSFAW